MNLIWFLTVGTIISIIFGEFGKYPFGVVSTSVGITDLMVAVTLGFFLIWKVGINGKIVIPTSFKLLMIFWLTAAFSLVLSGYLNGGLYLVRFMMYSSFFLIGWSLITDKQIKIENLISKIVMSGVLVSIIGFIQLIVLPNLASLTLYGFDPHNNRLVSAFLDPNFTGSFLNISFVLAIYYFLRNRQKSWLISSIIIFIAILLTFSRSAYLMLLIEILGIGFLKSKKLLIFCLAVLLISFLFLPQFNSRIIGALKIDNSAAERFSSWETGWQIFGSSPIFGIGFNNLKTATQTFQDANVHSGAGVDSSLLFVLATTGIFGLFSCLSWWGYLVWKFVRDRKNKDYGRIMIMLIGALLVNSQFINSLFYPEIMLIYFLLLGASIADLTSR